MSYNLYNFETKKNALRPRKDSVGSFLIYENGIKQYFLTTSITSGATTTTAVLNSFAITSHATGGGKIFVSRNSGGLKWFEVTGSGGGAVDSVNALTGTVVLTTEEISDSASTKKYVTTAEKTKLGNLSGTNTGDQDLSTYATKVGVETLTNKTLTSPSLTGVPTAPTATGGTNTTQIATTAFVNAASYTDEQAQDAIGAMIDTSLNYVDGTPLLQRSALTGDVTASAGSNTTTIATPASVTVAVDDKVLIKDTSASDATKYVSAQSIADLCVNTGIPQNSQSVAYTLVLSDSGKHILHPSADTTARTFTIPANSSVAFPVGAAVTFINQNAGGVITIAITTDTLRLAGAGTTGNRTLAANGIATAVKVTSTEWIISGTGLT